MCAFIGPLCFATARFACVPELETGFKYTHGDQWVAYASRITGAGFTLVVRDDGTLEVAENNTTITFFTGSCTTIAPLTYCVSNAGPAEGRFDYNSDSKRFQLNLNVWAFVQEDDRFADVPQSMMVIGWCNGGKP